MKATYVLPRLRVARVGSSLKNSDEELEEEAIRILTYREDIPIRCGIYESGSLSPLWFCCYIESFNVYMYTADIKLCVINENKLGFLLGITIQHRDIGMQLELEKFRNLSSRK